LSASDFTVELDISLEDYDQFYKNEYEPKGKVQEIPVGVFLKEYLKAKTEKILDRVLKLRSIQENHEKKKDPNSERKSFSQLQMSEMKKELNYKNMA
jgi:hypothetical protein